MESAADRDLPRVKRRLARVSVAPLPTVEEVELPPCEAVPHWDPTTVADGRSHRLIARDAYADVVRRRDRRPRPVGCTNSDARQNTCDLQEDRITALHALRAAVAAIGERPTGFAGSNPRPSLAGYRLGPRSGFVARMQGLARGWLPRRGSAAMKGSGSLHDRLGPRCHDDLSEIGRIKGIECVEEGIHTLV